MTCHGTCKEHNTLFKRRTSHVSTNNSELPLNNTTNEFNRSDMIWKLGLLKSTAFYLREVTCHGATNFTSNDMT